MGTAVRWTTDLGGGFRVTLLRTGSRRVDAGSLFGPVPRMLWSRLVTDELDGGHRVELALNALLVETPEGSVLVDPGTRGADADPGIAAALSDAGTTPEAIGAVVLTHLHHDHAGALLAADGSPAFRHARVVAQRREWAAAARVNARIAEVYDQPVLRALAAGAAGDAPDGDATVQPGVELLLTGGYTTGHQAVLVRAPGATPVAFLGDLLMRPWQANPRWITAFDDFPLDAVRVKAELFARAADERWTVVLSHEPGAAVGRLVPDRDRFRFEPLSD